jgi:hypothetical protein
MHFYIHSSSVPDPERHERAPYVTAEEAEQLLTDFRKDKDSIRVWLLQGRNHFVT